MEKSYIGDIVFGASDGLITTFAVVAGVEGASLSSAIVIILGMANLLADGVSMAAGNYLGEKSEQEVIGKRLLHTPQTSAGIMFLSFVVAGAIPLLPYVLGSTGKGAFMIASILTLVTIFVVGAARTAITKRPWLTSGLEMLGVGTVAAAVAYAVGYYLRSIVV